MSLFKTALQEYLSHRRNQNSLRSLPNHQANAYIDFSTNDYLGLSDHPEIIATAYAYAKEYGIGAKASRLLANRLPVHDELEKIIAKTKNTETALIFVSGYQANSCSISTLLDKKLYNTTPLVFSDKLNHASMHHGCKLAGAVQMRYRHLDLEHLSQKLSQKVTQDKPTFILTESLFGMDGDICDMKKISKLAAQYNAIVYIDDAHATGVLGKHGYGLGSEQDGSHECIILGTFSKGLGGSGAYIACSNLVKNLMLNACGGQIYSTALSPVLAGAALKAWEILPTMDKERAMMQANAKEFSRILKTANINAFYQGSHIVPVIIGSPEKTMQLQKMLLKSGFLVAAVRSPTVPQGTDRLRVAITSKHSAQEVTSCAECIKKCWKKLFKKT